jgi:hypothetical protein
MSRVLGYGGSITNFGFLESDAVLGLNIVFRESYNTDILQVWYHSTDIHSILSHVEFEDGLFISILKNRATRHKILQLEIENFLKIVKSIERPPLFSNPAVSISYVCCNHSRLFYLRAPEFQTIAGTYSKE